MTREETKLPPDATGHARRLHARLDELCLGVAEAEWPVVLAGAEWLDAAVRRVRAAAEDDEEAGAA